MWSVYAGVWIAVAETDHMLGWIEVYEKDSPDCLLAMML